MGTEKLLISLRETTSLCRSKLFVLILPLKCPRDLYQDHGLVILIRLVFKDVDDLSIYTYIYLRTTGAFITDHK